MKKLLASVAFLIPLTLSANSPLNLDQTNLSEKHAKPSRIGIDNRVLANVNDHPISVMDVMKKMDTYFYKDYPHLIDSDISRYQFYRGHWHFVFDDMVNNELVFADAKEKKVEVTYGDVRQELDRLYGPEIITNLDSIGLTYDEAWNMTQKDLYVRRMMSSILYLKGVYNASPNDLRMAFNEYAEKNRKPDQWVYHILSFRGPNALENAQMAEKTLSELHPKVKSFDTLALLFKEKVDDLESKKISISDQFQLKDTEISPSHKELLQGLSENSFSPPYEEMSRVDHKPVYRIFYLSSHIPGGDINFSEVEAQLKDSLVSKRADTEISTYIAGLRERFGVSQETLNEMVPPDFEPFFIK